MRHLVAAVALGVLLPSTCAAETLRVLVRVIDGAVLQWSVTEPGAAAADHVMQAAGGFRLAPAALRAHDVSATPAEIATIRVALAAGVSVTVPGLPGARAVILAPPTPPGPPSISDRLDRATTLDEVKTILKERLR